MGEMKQKYETFNEEEEFWFVMSDENKIKKKQQRTWFTSSHSPSRCTSCMNIKYTQWVIIIILH